MFKLWRSFKKQRNLKIYKNLLLNKMKTYTERNNYQRVNLNNRD